MVEGGEPERKNPKVTACVRIRIGGREAGRHGGNFRLRLRTGDTGLEYHVALDPPRVPVVQRVTAAQGLPHGSRNPELDITADECSVKILWRHADDGERHSVEALRLADDVRIAIEHVLPESIADDDDRIGVAASVLAGFESAAHNRADAERFEIIRGNDASGYALRAAANAERSSRDFVRDE